MTSGIIEILIENTNVQTLVGTYQVTLNNVPTSKYKVFPFIAPQGVSEPYILVSETSLNPTLGKGCPSTVDYPTYDVNCYGLSFRAVELLQEACRIALDNGQAWNTDAGAQFDQVYMSDRKDLFLLQEGQNKGLFVKSGTYKAIAKRTIT